MYFSLKTYENIFISPKSATGGLSKPQTLDEANAMFGKVQGEKNIYMYIVIDYYFFLREIKNPFFKDFDNACLKHLAILEGAAAAANEMTTHKEADDEVKALKERYVKVIRINPFHQA